MTADDQKTKSNCSQYLATRNATPNQYAIWRGQMGVERQNGMFNSHQLSRNISSNHLEARRALWEIGIQNATLRNNSIIQHNPSHESN